MAAKLIVIGGTRRLARLQVGRGVRSAVIAPGACGEIRSAGRRLLVRTGRILTDGALFDLYPAILTAAAPSPPGEAPI